MAQVVTFRDFRPSVRVDGEPWSGVRIDEKGSLDDQNWTEVDLRAFEDLDSEPASPRLRTITTDQGSGPWYRLTFVDDDSNSDVPSPLVYGPGPQYRPTLAGVGATLRARTYANGAGDDPLGSQIGKFTAQTSPTAEQVENGAIPQATEQLSLKLGTYVPGELLDAARQVATTRAAAEIERSYIPEQVGEGNDGSIYQTLRMTYEEQAKSLLIRLHWWFLANRRQS